jgi:hypothetical protein
MFVRNEIFDSTIECTRMNAERLHEGYIFLVEFAWIFTPPNVIRIRVLGLQD